MQDSSSMQPSACRRAASLTWRCMQDQSDLLQVCAGQVGLPRYLRIAQDQVTAARAFIVRASRMCLQVKQGFLWTPAGCTAWSNCNVSIWFDGLVRACAGQAGVPGTGRVQRESCRHDGRSGGL